MALNLFRIKEFVSEQDFEVAELYLAPDGKHFLYVFKIEGKYFAQYDDKVHEGFDMIESVSFKKSGRIFIYKYSSFSKKLGLIKDENQDFINIGGKVLGAFNKVKDFRFNENLTYYIWYESMGKSYMVLNNQKYGGYRAISRPFISPEGTSYAFQYKDGSMSYIKTAEETIGPYEEIRDFQIDYKNNFSAYIFKKPSGEFFVNINSKELGPYQNCSDLHFHADISTYYFFYTQEGVNFIQINNFVFGGYESYSIPVINKNFILVSCLKEKQNHYQIILPGIGSFDNIAEYALSSTGEEYILAYSKLGLIHVVAGDYEYGPYKKVSNLSISKDGRNFCFIFQKQYEDYYANINGSIFGPYPFISEVKTGNSDTNFGFIFQKNAKWFVNISNETHGLYEGASNLVLSDNGSGYSYKFTKRHKSGPMFAKLQTYLSLNGEVIENDIEIYDYLINSIGIEAIITRTKTGMYINLSETEFGPFFSISEYRFLQDDSLFSFKFKTNQNDPDHLQINGKQYFSQNKNTQIYAPIFSTDGKKYAFIHYGQHHQFVQICDETFGPYEFVHFPSFSPDNKIFIFKFMNEQMEYLNVNGMKLGPFWKAEYSFADGKLYICYLQENTIYIDEITW